MTTYRYTARTVQGDETGGLVEAESLDAALQMLIDRDLLELVVVALPDRPSPHSPPPVSLSSGEAGELGAEWRR